MIKLALFLFLSILTLKAEIYEIDGMESALFSKKSMNLKSITISLAFRGDEIVSKQLQLKDSLNILISSYYIEDLMTSKGKEAFKNSLKSFALKKYGLKLDSIYIKEFRLTKPIVDTDELIQKLQRGGCCQKSTKVKELFDSVKTAK